MSGQLRRAASALAITIVVAQGCTSVSCPMGADDVNGHCEIRNPVGEADGAVAGQSAVVAGTDALGDAGGSNVAGASAGSSAGAAAIGGGAAAGTDGASGVAGGAAGGAAGSAAEPCATAGASRCSMQGAGARDECKGGVWTAGSPCAAGETCVGEATEQPRCVTVAELCRGSAGMTVCDGQGSLIVCNPDESIKMQMTCTSAKHCQAGKASQTCAVCIPAEEYKCTDVTLEVCGADGMSFVKDKDCETAGLCNAKAGMCTDAVCAPGKITCDGNTLVTCNADGTAIANSKPCTGGTCDQAGGDCNMCEPGSKKCQGDMVMTCEPAGQTFMSSPCPSDSKHCIGLGQCVQCEGSEDCSNLTAGCKVGACNGYRCMAQNAPNGKSCTTSANKAGTCQNGTCECTPQCSGKDCGPDGCNGQCPNRCGSKMCSGSTCVDCLDSGDCPSNALECEVGVCTRGVCSTGAAGNGARCGSGTCQGGTCCTPDCDNKCGGADNGCNGRCNAACRTGYSCDTSSGTCFMDRRIYETCSRGDTSGGAERGNCAQGLVCTQIGPTGPNCWQATPCPSGMAEIIAGLGVCARTCMSNGSACPGATTCQNMNADTGIGFCML